MPVFIKKVRPAGPPIITPVQTIAQEVKLFNPMLAAEFELGDWDYSVNGPIIATPKLNGVRGVNQGGVIYPRSLKNPIKNDFTKNRFSRADLTNLDGELVVGDFADEDVFVISTSGVGAKAGEPDVSWYVFDMYHPTRPYIERLKMREDAVARSNHPNVELVPWVLVHDDVALVKYSDWALGLGYEGLVLRDPRAKYKTGRSTTLEGGFMRYCAWLRSEATIHAIEEGKVNQNVSKRNALGYLAKSSHKDNKVGSGQAGSFLVKDVVTGIEFNMAIPSDALQKAVWANPDRYIGAPAKYKFKPHVKKGGKPRFPQYEGIRADWDMS